MPTYTLTVPAHRLTAEQKARVAAGISRVHHELTGAATFFAQVIIHEVPAGNHFVGGRPLASELLFLHGQIRAGRGAARRRGLLLALRDVVAQATGAEPRGVWVYLVDLPAADMVEHGHLLPEPGGEAAWLEGLPEADCAHLLSEGGQQSHPSHVDHPPDESRA